MLHINNQSINHHGNADMGNRDSLLVKCRTRNRQVASSNPGRSGGKIFLSRVNFVC